MTGCCNQNLPKWLLTALYHPIVDHLISLVVAGHGQVEVFAAMVRIEEPLARQSITMCSLLVSPDCHRMCNSVYSSLIECVTRLERFSDGRPAVSAAQFVQEILWDKARLNEVDVQKPSKR